MSTLKQQITDKIQALPTDGNTKVTTEMLQEVLGFLNNKSEFSGEWSDLLNMPDDIYFENSHRAKMMSENAHFTLSSLASGRLVFVDSSSSVNVGVKVSDLPEGFECTLWQANSGFINLVDVEGASFITPVGKLSQTENSSDTIYMVVSGGKLFIKGNLKAE